MFKGIWTLFLILPAIANAQLDSASRDVLIDKLTHVYINLAPADTSKVPVTLRLADLLADRARVASMSDLESGCTICTAGEKDRQKALQLYREVLDRTPASSKGAVMIQMGHLFELTNQQAAALDFYNKVIKDAPDQNVAAEAHLSIAEMYFRKNQFKSSESHYAEVLKVQSAGSRGLAAYRLAWCHLNGHELDKAIDGFIAILKTPDLLSRAATSGGQIDKQFQEEVSRDLATAMARRKVESADVNLLVELSPDSTKVPNLGLLASEVERLGKKAEALVVWKVAHSLQKLPAQRLEALVHMAPLKFETGDLAGGLVDFEAALSLWKDLNGCGRADCHDMQKLIRQSVIVWNQAEKKSPSAELLKAYQMYASAFPADIEMALWGAQVAREKKMWPISAQLQESAISALRTSPDSDKLDAALLQYIEMAEASSDEDLVARSQNLYLEASPKKSKAFEVRYQQARHLYEKGQLAQASESLRALANDKAGSIDLRLQAANLSLDALAQLKNDAGLESWSTEFASLFPAQKTEFEQLAQKAILAQAATSATSGDNEQASNLLARFSAAKSSAEDRIKALHNRVLVAEKLGRLADGTAAAQEILALKTISEEERQFALGRQAYFAELQLDFATALKATEKITVGSTPEQKLLKLALYADLSGQNSLPYYGNFLKVSKDLEEKQTVAAVLVRKSANPVKEIETQKTILEKNPSLLARLYIETYAKSPTDKILKTALNDLKVKSTDWGRILDRTSLLIEYATFKKSLSALKLENKNQKVLAKSIKTRAAALEKAEALANRAIQMADWTSQLVTLDLIARESARFYEELLSLPVPEGISGDEEQQYLALLGQQAAPFKTKADQALAKVNEFWASPNWQSDLQKSVESNAELSSLTTQEIQLLTDVAPESPKQFLASLKPPTAPSGPSLAEVEAMRDQVRKHPFDRTAVENLMGLEKESKNFAMVQYLEGRLKVMDDKKETR